MPMANCKTRKKSPCINWPNIENKNVKNYAKFCHWQYFVVFCFTTDNALEPRYARTKSVLASLLVREVLY